MVNAINVKDFLPHREPFLFIDQIVRVDSEEIECQREIKPNEFYFQGHFPGRPIFPGVLMVESIAQAGILLVLVKEPGLKGKMPLFAGIERVRFRRIVQPGEVLRIVARLVQARAGIYRFEGRTFVGDEVTCEAVVTGVVR